MIISLNVDLIMWACCAAKRPAAAGRPGHGCNVVIDCTLACASCAPFTQRPISYLSDIWLYYILVVTRFHHLFYISVGYVFTSTDALEGKEEPTASSNNNLISFSCTAYSSVRRSTFVFFCSFATSIISLLEQVIVDNLTINKSFITLLHWFN